MERMVYTAKEIQALLGINKNATYELIHEKETEWKIKKIGNRILIPKGPFEQWLAS